MKLITAAMEKTFHKYPIGSQDGKDRDSVILAKFFGGCACTWLVTEAEKKPDGDWLFFGLANLGWGWEWGTFLFSELKDLRFPPFGLPLERDMYLERGITVREYMKQYLYGEEDWM